MTTFKEAFAKLATDEGVYCLYLSGEQARATLRALQVAPAEDEAAREAAERLQRLLTE